MSVTAIRACINELINIDPDRYTICFLWLERVLLKGHIQESDQMLFDLLTDASRRDGFLEAFSQAGLDERERLDVLHAWQPRLPAIA